ncbi:MAG: hypothetical protein AAGF88_11030 [Pseudomonadota bacterium]
MLAKVANAESISGDIGTVTAIAEDIQAIRAGNTKGLKTTRAQQYAALFERNTLFLGLQRLEGLP